VVLFRHCCGVDCGLTVEAYSVDYGAERLFNADLVTIITFN